MSSTGEKHEKRPFFGVSRSKMEVNDLRSEKSQNRLGVMELGGCMQNFSSLALQTAEMYLFGNIHNGSKMGPINEIEGIKQMFHMSAL